MEHVFSNIQKKPLALENKKLSKIFQACDALFSSEGYLYTTMEAVAEYASMSKATLYRLFQNKDELLFSYLQWKLYLLSQENRLIEDKGSIEQQLMAYGLLLMDNFSSELLLSSFRTFASIGRSYPELSYMAFDYAAPARNQQALHQIFVRGVRRGELAFDNFEVAGKQFLLMCRMPTILEVMLLGEAPPRSVLEIRVQDAVRAFLSRYGTTQESE